MQKDEGSIKDFEQKSMSFADVPEYNPVTLEQIRLAALIKDIGLALIQSDSLSAMTQQCAVSLVSHFDAAFARIWMFNAQTQILELQGSAGLYTHLDGPHSQIPLGSFKIGLIASERLPHLTNSIGNDPRISDQEWAAREGMVAFAGYPLLVEEQLVGVMALFARQVLSATTLDAMSSVANLIALGINRKQGELERAHLLSIEQQDRAAAEASRQRLASILDHLTDGFMIFDHQWRYLYINPQARPFTGKPREVLLGKTVWEEFPNLVGSTFYQQYHKAVAQQEPVSFEVFSSLLNDWFDVRAYPIADGLAVYFRTITERVRAEEERKRLLELTQQAQIEAETARQRVTDILESINDAFFALDRSWKFTYLNSQSEPLLQRSRDELLGRNIWLEFPDAVDSAFYRQYHLALEQQVRVSFDEFYLPLDTWFEVSVYPSPNGLSIYFRNINERKEAEKERERLLQLEQQAHAEATAALEIRNSFLSSISHDLKTPLASIRASTQLVLRRVNRGQLPDTSWLVERLTMIEGATTKMNGMIEDLLDLARSQSGQHLENPIRALDLLPLLERVIVEQRETTRRHLLVLKTDLSSLPMYGNTGRLDRALTNLLGNAIKYSPKGGEVLVEVTRVVQENRSWAVLRVTDQGLGIPSADLPHVFEPFHRAANVANRIQGTGIGLASVAQVVEQHGGSILVSSTEGLGSCFTVRLPLSTEDLGQVASQEL